MGRVRKLDRGGAAQSASELGLELFLDVARRGVQVGLGSLFLLLIAILADPALFMRRHELLAIAVGLAATSLLRILSSARINKNAPSAESFARTRVLYGALVWASGLLWMLLTLGVLAQKGLDHRHSMLVMILLSGIAASATSSIAADAALVLGYLALSLLAPALYLLTQGELGVLLAAIGFVYAAFLFGNARIYRANLVELHRQRRELRDEKELIHRIIDAIPGPVAFFDSELRYRAVNQRLLDQQELTGNELIGTGLGQVISTSAVVEFVRSFAAQPELKEVSQNLAVDFPRETRWHRVTLARDETGGIICIAVDIQREVELETQERENRARIANAAKLAALGEMAAGIAHEINNPLSIIAMKANQLDELGASGQVSGETLTRHAQKIHETCFRISKIIRGLRALARDGEGDPFAPARAREIVDDVLGLCLERFRDHKVALKVEEIPDVTFSCRSAQVAQVLLNLITNAFDAAACLGQLSAGQTSPGGWVQLQVEVRQTHLVFIVSDSGPGVPESLVEKIMEPFFTTKGVGKGTGLGLSISRRILADHQGRLELTKTRGPTTFEASFSLEPQPALPESDSETMVGSAQERSA
jgi:C4-dicarboxylate-specific signal transduction histidine kinase